VNNQGSTVGTVVNNITSTEAHTAGTVVPCSYTEKTSAPITSVPHKKLKSNNHIVTPIIRKVFSVVLANKKHLT